MYKNRIKTVSLINTFLNLPGYKDTEIRLETPRVFLYYLIILYNSHLLFSSHREKKNIRSTS